MDDTDLIRLALVETFGERCPDFDPGCMGCQAWSEFDRLTAHPVQEPPSPGVTAGAIGAADLGPLAKAAQGMKRIVEEIDGAMNHGTWRDEKGVRLKDTPEWVALYNAISNHPATPAPVVPAEGLDALIDLIGEFGREVYYLLDDCETSGPVGKEVHTITDDGLMKVSALLDRIDALPFEEPGVILGPGAMLQTALKQTITALRTAQPVGVWPDFIAPPKYETQCEGWEDPRLPDFRLIWETARALGYAIGLHGSMKRDCDLIAAPWVDNPAHPDDLIKALCVALNATQVGGVEAKPVGRIAVTLQIDGYVKHIDLSIMPAPPVGARVSIPPGLIDALRSQRQIDADGCEVAVSRQACDEAAAILAALLPAGEGE